MNMQPTMNLRFIQRETKVFVGESTYTYRIIKILQQQFVSTTTPDNEWRDVPLEKSE